MKKLASENILGEKVKYYCWFAIKKVWLNGENRGNLLIKVDRTSKEYFDAIDWYWIDEMLSSTQIGKKFWGKDV
jgi:hypothetical protein